MTVGPRNLTDYLPIHIIIIIIMLYNSAIEDHYNIPNLPTTTVRRCIIIVYIRALRER